MLIGLPARVPAVFNPAALGLGVLVLFPAVTRGATLYVDQKISVTTCTTYSPATRSCGGGSSRAYLRLYDAANAAVAGDKVYLRAGSYSGQLSPARSGTASLPITFAAYAGEKPTLSGNPNPALWLVKRSNIVVDGLTVTNVGGWGRLEDASYNIIRNCAFSVAAGTGTGGGLKLVRSTYNKIVNNTFNDGNDNVTIQESDRNVIQGNRISKARHSLLSIRCGNVNVVRGNVFSNPDQKALEIYDCAGVSDAPYKLNATQKNLIEKNLIMNTRASSARGDFNGIQLGGQHGIIRHNVFRTDHGGGVNFQYYADESLYNYKNRLYNNTFYDNDCYGIVGASGNSSHYYDNRARNNILYKNTSCSGAATQTYIANASQVILTSNAITTTSPRFVNESAYDLHLASGSPMIDAGAFLTTTTAAGSGTTLPVADPGYFYGGFGIPGELGDEIGLQGQTTVARILGVDSTGKRLFLDRSLTWANGTGVALRYSGSRPDQGAYEYTGSTTTQALALTSAVETTGVVTSSYGDIGCGTGCSRLALTIAKTGTGAGTVTSVPAGISCGPDCFEAYHSGTLVTLTAAPERGSVFTGWTGACTGTGPCRITMDSAQSVSASFGSSLNVATVTKRGEGSGTVTSSPPGIDCGNDCAEPYDHGTVVTLTAVATAGSRFNGWSGACSGAGPCRVRMDASRDAVATFSISGAKTPVPGDFDGDGKPDLLWQNWRTGQLKAWLLDHGSMTTDPLLTPLAFADASWQVRGVADFNGDGHSDILWQERRTGRLKVWLMDRTSLVSSVDLRPTGFGHRFAWEVRGLADFNRDGKPDVLWQDQGTGALHVSLMDGTVAVGEVSLASSATVDTRWQVQGVADFDGDGEADVLWRNQQTGDLRVWLIKGMKVAGVRNVAPARVPDRHWRIVRVADLDEDGHPDILWHNRDTGDLLVWYMNGVTLTSRAPLDPSPFLESDWIVVPSPER